MKRNGDTESVNSLEMLLDTMCNTFGGTIFLAIALIIIASMSKQAIPSLEEENARTAAALSREIESLEAQSQRLSEEINLKSEIARQLKNDPRLKYVAEVAAMQDQNRKLVRQLEIEEMKRNQTVQEEKAESTLLDQTQNRLKKEKEIMAKKREELALVKAEIIKIGEQNAALPKNLTLKKIQKVSGTEAPYFIIAKAGKLWRIGPDVISPININGDVTFRRILNTYDCSPIPEKGTPILVGDTVSREAEQLLSNLPAGRYPAFQVYPDCAAEHFKLLEALKRGSRSYAVSTKSADMPAGFILASQGEYER